MIQFKIRFLSLALLAGCLVSPAEAQTATTSLRGGPGGIVALVPQSISLTALAKDPGWKNPNVKGFLIRAKWSDIEPSRGAFDFTLFQGASALALKNHKFLGLSIGAGSNSPEWIYTEGAQQFFFTPPSDGPVRTIPEPWDPVFLTLWDEMIVAFGQAFDHNSTVAYVVMSGPGRDYEMGYVTEPDEVANFDLMGGQQLWGAATVQIAQLFAANFSHTHLIYAMAPPTPDAEGAATVSDAMTTLFQDYPRQFGVACASLAPTTAPTIPSVAFIQAQSSHTTCGFQMFGPASIMATNQVGRSNQNAVTILSQSLVKGVQYGAHYVEVYSPDCSTANQQANLKTANSGLTSTAIKAGR